MVGEILKERRGLLFSRWWENLEVKNGIRRWAAATAIAMAIAEYEVLGAIIFIL